jgi:hypothetical protein
VGKGGGCHAILPWALSCCVAPQTRVEQVTWTLLCTELAQGLRGPVDRHHVLRRCIQAKAHLHVFREGSPRQAATIPTGRPWLGCELRAEQAGVLTVSW